ncbi:MAG: alkaline phosphatase family protein [Anaerolineae bacterium]|jgi:hypothetical protein
MDQVTEIETAIRGTRPANLEGVLPQHFVFPHYAKFSIANLAGTIAKILGVTLENGSPPLPEQLWTEAAADVRRVILLLVDACGYLQLRRHLAGHPSILGQLAQLGSLVPLTSVFPSTTVSALTTIWTGRAPLEHGFLGTRLLLPEQGLLANLLKMAPAAHTSAAGLEDWGWDPAAFVEVPSLANRLRTAGIETVAHTRTSFIGSSLTRIFLDGMETVRGYVALSDLWVNLRRSLIETRVDRPLFVGAYWGGLDAVGHTYGPSGEHMTSALTHWARSFEEDFLESLPPSARTGTLLMITSDHGLIATPPHKVVRLPHHPELRETLLLPPAGESRAAYLYARPGQRDALQAYVNEHLADRFVLLDTEEALRAGLFGTREPPTSAQRVRLADLLLIASDDSRLDTSEEQEGTAPLLGHHGSMTPEEMLVPLLIAPLDHL